MPDDPHTRAHDELLTQLGWMRVLAHRLVLDPDVADDVLQRACLLALEKPPRHTAGPGWRAWLSTTIRRLAGHASRSESRRRQREHAAARPEALPATIDIALRREILRKLVDAVTSLPEPLFGTIVRRYHEGLAATAIAAQDGVSPEAVRQRLARARRQIRTRLESDFGRDLPGLPLLVALGQTGAAGVARPASHSHHDFGGLAMAKQGSTAALLKLCAAACILVGAWFTGRLLLPGDGTSPDPSGEPTARRATSAPATPRIPSVAADPAAAAIPVPTPIAPLSGAAARPAAEQPAPPPSSGALQDRLWATTDALVDGTVTISALTGLASTLLADVDLTAIVASAADARGAPVAIFDEPGFGKATLLVSLAADEAADGGSVPFDCAIDVALETRSGYYTGFVQEVEERTDLTLRFRVDGKGTLTSCGAVAQNLLYGPTRELFDALSGRDPLAYGGAFHVDEGGASWRQLTLRASRPEDHLPENLPEQLTADDRWGFSHQFTDAFPRPDLLADARLAPVVQSLSAARAAAAR
jgi:RNA polymerase sigma-70 factor (ECF subfamily)